MFVKCDPETGRPVFEGPNEDCIHSVEEMRAAGFSVIETVRTILCTEVHFNGPFHLQFEDGTVIAAVEINSDYAGIKSTHRVVLVGNIPGDRVAFRAIPDQGVRD